MYDTLPGSDISKISMGVNPNGYPPNFDHGPSLIRAVQGVGISLAFLAAILLTVRLRIYIKLNRGLVLDDIFLLIAYVMALSYTVQASTLGRLCKHTWDTPLGEINPDYLKKLLATSILYGPMFFFAKAAILILYYRAFKPKVWIRRTCWILAIVLLGAHWHSVPLNFIYCMPHNGKPWDFEVLVNCNHLKIPGLVHGGVNIAADVILVLLPVPIIAKLQVPLSRKIALSAMFATGLLALICSVLAVYYRVQIILGKDPIWSNAQAWIVIQAEIYAAICVACAPSLSKFLKMDFKSTRLYTAVRPLLRYTNGSKRGSYPAARRNKGRQPSSESVAALHPVEVNQQGHSLSSAHASNESYEMQGYKGDNGIYRQVAFDVRSEASNVNAV